MDVTVLTGLLREAEDHHGAYEPTAPKHHWSGWYAAYITAREAGRTPDEAASDAGLHLEALRAEALRAEALRTEAVHTEAVHTEAEPTEAGWR